MESEYLSLPHCSKLPLHYNESEYISSGAYPRVTIFEDGEKEKPMYEKFSELFSMTENKKFVDELLKPQEGHGEAEQMEYEQSFGLPSPLFSAFGMASLFPKETMFYGAYDNTGLQNFYHNSLQYQFGGLLQTSHEDISKIINNTTHLQQAMQQSTQLVKENTDDRNTSTAEAEADEKTGKEDEETSENGIPSHKRKHSPEKNVDCDEQETSLLTTQSITDEIPNADSRDLLNAGTNVMMNIFDFIDPIQDIESNMFNSTIHCQENQAKYPYPCDVVPPSVTTNTSLEIPTSIKEKVQDMFEKQEKEEILRECHTEELLMRLLPDAFTIWQEKFRTLVKEEYPNATKKEIDVKLAEIWQKIPEDHREKYQIKADEVLHKYKQDLNVENLDRLRKYKQDLNVENLDRRPSKSKRGRCKKTRGRNTSHLLKPIPVRAGNEKISNEKDKTENTDQECMSTNNDVEKHIDYTKALKETMSYNSPDKYIKRKIEKHQKRKDEEEEEDELENEDENMLATGFLQDLMMNGTSNVVNEDRSNTKTFNSPSISISSYYEDILIDGPLNVNDLDSYLTGDDSLIEKSYHLDVNEEMITNGIKQHDEEQLLHEEELKKTKKIMKRKRREQTNRYKLLEKKERKKKLKRNNAKKLMNDKNKYCEKQKDQLDCKQLGDETTVINELNAVESIDKSSKQNELITSSETDSQETSKFTTLKDHDTETNIEMDTHTSTCDSKEIPSEVTTEEVNEKQHVEKSTNKRKNYRKSCNRKLRFN